jgi:hypothetical protein
MAETDDKRPQKPLWSALLSGMLTGYLVLLAVYFAIL